MTAPLERVLTMLCRSQVFKKKRFCGAKQTKISRQTKLVKVFYAQEKQVSTGIELQGFVVSNMGVTANHLFASSASANGFELNCQNNVMTWTKPERELRLRKECAAQKLIDTFRNCHLIKVCVANHKRTENCRNCELEIP